MSASVFLGRSCFLRRNLMSCVVWEREYWRRSADICSPYLHSLYQVARDLRLRPYTSIHLPTNANITTHKTTTTIMNIEMKMKVPRQRDITERKRSDEIWQGTVGSYGSRLVWMSRCRSECWLGNKKRWGIFWEGEDGEKGGNMRVRCRILDSRGEVPKQEGSLGAVNSIISSANGNYLSCKRDCSCPSFALCRIAGYWHLSWAVKYKCGCGTIRWLIVHVRGKYLFVEQEYQYGYKYKTFFRFSWH